MIAMRDVVAADNTGAEHRIGSMHKDGRGFVAWDINERWLGKTARSRFATEAKALEALEAAFASATGVAVRAIRWE